MKAFQSNFGGTKRSIARVVCAIICLALCAYQVASGVKMMKDNAQQSSVSTYEHFDSFTENQVVIGVLTKIDVRYIQPLYDEPLNFSLCLSDTGHIMTFRTMPGSDMDDQMSKLYYGDISELYYKGKVKVMNDKYRSGLILQMMPDKASKKINTRLTTDEALLPYEIDVSPYDASYSDKAVVATFVGAVLMFLLSLVFMWKIFKDAAESVLSAKGKYKPKLKVTKDDLEFEMQETYSSDDTNADSFYINTEFNTKDYGVYKENSRADRTQLPSANEDPALNRSADDQPLFYTSDVNDEGNFYVDSKREASTDFGKKSSFKKY